jgi:hypothetical protein
MVNRRATLSTARDIAESVLLPDLVIAVRIEVRMASDAARPFWVLCVVLGVGVIGFIAWLAAVIPIQTCSGRPPGTPAFLAYQLSRTVDDVEAVFGQEGDPCRAAMVAALDLANRVDLIAFVATYSGFLACFFLALIRSGFVGFPRVGLVAVVATFFFNLLQTSTQLYITASLPGTILSLVLLTIGSTGKFLGIALADACAGVVMLARGGILGRFTGAACVAGALMVVVGLNYFPARWALPAGIAVAWFVMLIYAAAAVAHGAPSAAR